MTCPICKGPRKNIVINIEGTILQEWATCEACEIYFLRDMPTEEEALKYYTSGNYRDRIHRKRANRMPDAFTYEVILESFRAMHIMIVMKSLGLTPERFLDIGTGVGALPWGVTRAWKECGAEGVEPLGEFVLDRGITIYNTIDEVTKTYNVITCIHALEHMVDPIAFLGKVDKILEPEGTLILEVPIYLPGQYYSGFSPGHLYVYTPNGIRNVVERAGLFAKSHMVHGWPTRIHQLTCALVVVEHKHD